MKRKVSLHGPSTLTVSLPSSWVKRYGIKKGDEVEVEENSGNLSIKTKNSFAFKKRQVDLSKLGPLIRRCIKKFYQEGYDELELSYDQASQISDVQDFIPQLIGYEIVEHGNSRCLVKDVTKTGDGQFNQLLKRMFFLLKGILSDTYLGLEKNDLVMLKNAKLRDREVNRLANYCIRDLYKHNKEDERKIIDFLQVYHCEKLGDVYKDMVLTMVNEKIEADEKFLAFHKKIEGFFGLVINFTFESTVKKAIEIDGQHKKIKRLLEEELLKSNLKESKPAFFLRDMLEMMMILHEIELGQLKDL